MLTIEIKLNGLPVAEASVRNMTELSDLSDYEVVWLEYPNEKLGIASMQARFRIRDHRRQQSAWCLVAKVCEAILGQMVVRAQKP